MQLSTNTEIKEDEITQATSYNVKCFQEQPRKRGQEKPVARIGAFDLFNLFTADIIRSKKVFTR